jgi:hypothetical protein
MRPKPTVYAYQHIGNLRAHVFADTLRRVLEWKGHDVAHVINNTDIGHLTSDLGPSDVRSGSYDLERSGMMNLVNDPTDSWRDVRCAPPTQQYGNGNATLLSLFVTPEVRTGSFHASIRGHLLDLADPSRPGLAPTPDDLLVASLAAHATWSTQEIIGANRRGAVVSVAASWRPHNLARVVIRVTLSQVAAVECREIARQLFESLPAPWNGLSVHFDVVSVY